MKTGRQGKAKGRSQVPVPERRKKPWDPLEREDDPFEDNREDPGSDEYIWPEIGDEDEDAL